jgi:DNA-binding response OmpR family regulator
MTSSVNHSRIGFWSNASRFCLRRATPKDGAPAKEVNSNVLESGRLRMDPERHSCTWKNEPVTLTVTEFLILQALASRPGVVKSRNALMDAAYDDRHGRDALRHWLSFQRSMSAVRGLESA